GDPKLADKIAASRLGQKLEHSDFWRTVILFFVSYREMALNLVQPIVDFIQSNTFAGEEIVTANGTGYRKAPWPDFSIKGRTPASMMRLVEDWNADLTENKPQKSFSWPQSGIRGFRLVENSSEDQREWTIHELVTSSDLYLEGRNLRHCAYTYAPDCRRGQ